MTTTSTRTVRDRRTMRTVLGADLAPGDVVGSLDPFLVLTVEDLPAVTGVNGRPIPLCTDTARAYEGTCPCWSRGAVDPRTMPQRRLKAVRGRTMLVYAHLWYAVHPGDER